MEVQIGHVHLRHGHRAVRRRKRVHVVDLQDVARRDPDRGRDVAAVEDEGVAAVGGTHANAGAYHRDGWGNISASTWCGHGCGN